MKHLLIVLLLFSSVLMFAQPATSIKEKVKVEMGTPEKLSYTKRNNGIVMETEKNLFVFETKYRFLAKPKYYIAIFDRAKMSKIKEVELKLPKKNDGKKNRQVNFEAIDVIGQNMVLITSFYSRKDKITTIYMQKIGEDGKLADQVIELEKVNAITSKKGIKITNKGSFKVIASPDNSKFMVVKVEKNFDRYADAKVHQKVFDKDLNIVWSGELTFPFTSQIFNFRGFEIDNNGNIYYLIKKWKAEVSTNSKGKTKVKMKRSKTGAPNYFYSLLYYDYKKELFKTYEIDLGAKRITDIVFKVNPKNNDIICAGFYSAKSEYAWSARWRSYGYLYIGPDDAIGGSFYLRINKESAKIEASEYKDFDDKFKDLFGSKKKELKDFDLTDFAVLDDGSAALIAEQYYVNVRSYGQGNNKTYTYWYHYHDLVVIKFNNMGKVEWYNRIPKKQATKNDGGYFSSYIFNFSNENMHFIFIDSKGNTKRLQKQTSAKKPLKAGPMFFPQLSVAVLVTLDFNGNMTRSNLFQSSDAKSVLVPFISRRNNASDIGTNTLYVYGIKYGIISLFLPYLPSKYKYGRLTFEKQ